MRVLQGKRGSGGVSIRGPTRQEGLSTGQELGGAQWVQHSKKRVPLWDRKVSTESQRARRGSPKEQRGAQGVPQHKKFPKGAEGCPWMSHRAVAAPSKHKAGPPSLSPHSLLRQLRQRQFLHLQDPAQEQESPGERGKESGISREPGVSRESAGTGPGTYRRHTCSPGGPLLGSARLGLARSSLARFGSLRRMAAVRSSAGRPLFMGQDAGRCWRCARCSGAAGTGPCSLRAVLTGGVPGRAQPGPCSPGAVLIPGPCSARGNTHPRAVLTGGGAVPCRAQPRGRAHPRGGPCRAHPGAVLCSRRPCPTPGPCSPRAVPCRAVPCRVVPCLPGSRTSPPSPAPSPLRAGRGVPAAPPVPGAALRRTEAGVRGVCG